MIEVGWLLSRPIPLLAGWGGVPSFHQSLKNLLQVIRMKSQRDTGIMKKGFVWLLLLALSCVALGSCKSSSSQGSKIQIGFSMDSELLERWQKDRDQFVARARELGAQVLVQSADGNDATQVRQCENLLTQGVKVLVIVPHNGEVMASIVNSAVRQHVPVISYDRLIRNSDVSLYISYDNVKVGELQAKYLLDRAPKGNYILIGGAPTDNNARMFRQGQMNVLQPAIQRGDISIIADQWSRDWLASEALNHTENALTQSRNNVVAVVASNDNTAGGTIQALQEQHLAGKVLVSGQDADLAAAQRIVEGTQSMTVYKPIAPLARQAAEAAVALANGNKVETHSTVNNGFKDVPAILLDPIAVDKGNLTQTVIKDGFLKVKDVYRNLPESQWPQESSLH
jgi:D-xylose transport system substrate-binding protein